MTSRARGAVVSLAIAGAVAGCGGGGSEGAGYDLQITYARKPLTAGVFDDAIGQTVCEAVTVSPVPAAPTVRVLDSGGTFTSGPASLFEIGSGRFIACVPMAYPLVAGSHTGTLTVEVCKDLGCAQLYWLSDPSLPYQVTVWHVVAGLPPLTAVIKLDGVVTTDVNEGLTNDIRTYSVTMVSGQTIEVDPSEPFVLVSFSGGATATLTFLGGTQAGGVLLSATLPTGVASGTNVLKGRSSDGRTIQVSLTVVR